LIVTKMDFGTMIGYFHHERFIRLSYVNVIIVADIIKADVFV
jgi:hypothetical protein